MEKEQDQSFQQTRSKQEEDSESLSQDQNQENVNLSRIRTLSNISLKNSKFQLQNQILFNDLDSQKQRNSHQNSQALSVEKEVSPRKGSYSSKKGSKKSKISHQENERILMPTQLHFDNKLDQRSSDIQIKNIKSEISNEDIILQQQQVKQPAQKNQYQKSVTTYENSQKQTQKKFCRKKRKSFTQINQKNLLQEEQEEIDAMCTKDQINSQESNNFKKLPTNYLNKIHLNNASNDKQLTNLQNIQNVNSHGGNNSSLFPTINLHPNLQYQNSNSLNTINQANIQQPKTQISQSSSHTIYKSKIQNPVIQILPSIINQLNQMFLQNQSSQNTNSQINKNIIDTNINSEELQTLFGKNINSQQKQYMKFNQNAVDGDLIPLNMDIQKNYQFYFPQNNFDKISNVFNQRLKCKLQQKKCSPKRIRRSKNELTLIQDIQLN